MRFSLLFILCSTALLIGTACAQYIELLPSPNCADPSAQYAINLYAGQKECFALDNSQSILLNTSSFPCNATLYMTEDCSGSVTGVLANGDDRASCINSSGAGGSVFVECVA